MCAISRAFTLWFKYSIIHTTNNKRCLLSDKIVCIVRDNGRNIVSTLEGSPFEHISCLAHSLQLVIKDGILNKQMVKDLATKCRMAQIQLNIKRHKLIQDEPTRWNSLLQMMRHLPVQKEAVVHYNGILSNVFEKATYVASGSAVTVSE
ncbi:hypothetical protein J437_LFUL019643, partial [Ladona fulva]